MMLELHNVRMEPSNVRKKKGKGTAQYEKRTVTCDVGTAQCKDRTIKCEKKSKRTTKCEKKVRKPPNVRKKLSHVMLELHNVRIKPSTVRKK